MSRQKPKKRASKQIKNRKSRFFLPYPLLIFLTLCAGVFLVAATLNVSANDLLVSAKVAGPPVTSPAAITSPVNGTHFSSVPISVSGTCPANAAYIELFRNNVMSGTAICSGGNFQLSSDLFVGRPYSLKPNLSTKAFMLAIQWSGRLKLQVVQPPMP
jgi:hypothetical protein